MLCWTPCVNPLGLTWASPARLKSPLPILFDLTAPTQLQRTWHTKDNLTSSRESNTVMPWLTLYVVIWCYSVECFCSTAVSTAYRARESRGTAWSATGAGEAGRRAKSAYRVARGLQPYQPSRSEQARRELHRRLLHQGACLVSSIHTSLFQLWTNDAPCMHRMLPLVSKDRSIAGLRMLLVRSQHH